MFLAEMAPEASWGDKGWLADPLPDLRTLARADMNVTPVLEATADIWS